jgi:hypothetical protein
VPELDHHAFLRLLAESLAASLASGGSSVLVHVSPQPDGPAVGFLPLDGAAPAYGLTLDCLQRALGLPTAPPQVSAVQLVATALLEAVVDSGDPVPALALLDAGTNWSALGWERLRQLVADGRWFEPTLAPEDAAWFDEGGFSRWALSDRPTLPAAEPGRRGGGLRRGAPLRRRASRHGCRRRSIDLPARRERRRRRAG